MPKRLLPSVAGTSVLTAALLLAGTALFPSAPCARQTTLLIPSTPRIDAPVESAQPADQAEPAAKGAQAAAGQSAQAAPQTGQGTPQQASPEAGKDAAAGKQQEKNAKKETGKNDKNAKKDAAQAKNQEKTDKGTAKKDGQKTDKKGHAGQDKVQPAEVTIAASTVNEAVLSAAVIRPLDEEFDMLIAGMDIPDRHGIPMDMPRIFTLYRFDKDQADPDKPASREDLLGDVEEIRFLDQKAWGANVGVTRKGLYQYSVETRPWWDPEEQIYEQHIVKGMLPVYGATWGWHLPIGLSFEILPTTRPFGLPAPALFSGIVLANGEPVKNTFVEFQRVPPAGEAKTPWKGIIEVRTDQNGAFSAVLGKSGWWCVRAEQTKSSLKAPDGESAPLIQSTLFWLYVDDAPVTPKKQK